MRYNVRKLDPDLLKKKISEIDIQIPNPKPDSKITEEEAEKIIGSVMRLMRDACDAAMPRKSCLPRRKPVYWWNQEIAGLRKKALQARRRAQRFRRRGSAELTEAAITFTYARKALKKAIRKSRIICWRGLLKDLDSDIWGLGYQIVMRRTGSNPTVGILAQAIMEEIVRELFPTHDEREWVEIRPEGDIPLFTVAELSMAVSSMKNKKAPGLDGIPSEAIKLAVTERPDIFLYMFNACLLAGIFGRKWKRQKLVLLDKGKGAPITPSSFRPLCMIDNMGKVYEKLLRKRLRTAIVAAGGLSANQHGFRENHSTAGAIKEVVSVAYNAWQGNHRSRQSCILVTLDVKNAFNSAGWTDILLALEHRFSIPKYLRRIMSHYLTDRELHYENTEGLQVKKVTAGVAQGSPLGPDIWNVLYDAVISVHLPEYAKLIGFADDIAVVVLAKDAEQAQRRVPHTIALVKDKLDELGLELATQKTEMVVLTRQRSIPRPLIVKVEGDLITSVKAVKYLGLMIDEKLSFGPHIAYAASKAEKSGAALARLMPNIDGPRTSKRQTLIAVVNSIMLYGAEVWADAMEKEKYRRKLSTIQRRAALRVACAYRTVSEDAIMVISAVPPIDLLAKERARKAASKSLVEGIGQYREHTFTIEEWQRRWDRSDKGRWTHTLIPDIKIWTERKYGDVNFFTTQLLSGHGAFNAYLHKMKRKSSPKCQYCQVERDDALHTFFVCNRWSEERRVLEREIGYTPATETIISKMVENRRSWEKIQHFTEVILRAKKREEREED